MTPFVPQGEAPGLSGRRGGDKGNPSPTYTHLYGAPRFTEESYLLAERHGMASQALNFEPGCTIGIPAVETPTEWLGEREEGA